MDDETTALLAHIRLVNAQLKSGVPRSAERDLRAQVAEEFGRLDDILTEGGNLPHPWRQASR